MTASEPAAESTVVDAIAQLARHAPAGGMYGLQPMKRQLASQIGPSAAAGVFAEAAGWGAGWSAVRLPVVGLESHAFAHGRELQILSPAQSLVAPALEGPGGTIIPAMPVNTRSVFFCELVNAVVMTKSNIIVCDGKALLDALPHERASVPLNLDVDASVIAHEPIGSSGNEFVWSLVADAARQRFFPTALSLLGVHTYAFGHWMTEFLPKLWMCMERDGFPDVPVLVDDRMPKQHFDALRYFLGQQHPVVVVPYGSQVHVGSLWCCSMPSYFPVGPHSDADFTYQDGLLNVDGRFFRGLLDSALAKAVRPQEVTAACSRLFLSRGEGLHRRLVNADAVEHLFEENGFECHDFSTLEFLEQLALIRSAEMVAGPDGSAFMMTYFGRPGLRILCLCGPNVEDHQMYTMVTRELEQRYDVVVGEFEGRTSIYSGMSDFRIDPAQALAWLDRGTFPCSMA